MLIVGPVWLLPSCGTWPSLWKWYSASWVYIHSVFFYKVCAYVQRSIWMDFIQWAFPELKQYYKFLGYKKTRSNNAKLRNEFPHTCLPISIYAYIKHNQTISFFRPAHFHHEIKTKTLNGESLFQNDKCLVLWFWFSYWLLKYTDRFPFFFLLLLQASLLTALRITDTSCKIEIAVITAALFLCGAIMWKVMTDDKR